MLKPGAVGIGGFFEAIKEGTVIRWATQKIVDDDAVITVYYQFPTMEQIS
jgi:hypothetical protein